MTLLDLAVLDADAPALDDLTRRRTRGELVERAFRFANWLHDEVGVQRGDHIAQLMGNRVEFFELCLGAQLAGVWITPINWHLTPGEVAYVLADSGARVLIVDPDHEEVGRGEGSERPVLVAGDELDGVLGGSRVDGPDLAAAPGGNMFYTSGTTGDPKGVKRRPPGTVLEALQRQTASGGVLGLDGNGPHLVTGPLYHAAPLGFAVMDQHAGAEVIVMPRFDAASTLNLISTRRIRNTHLVPTMFVRLLRLARAERDAGDRSSLHTVLHGAAPISETVKRRMIEWWGPVLVEYWGASEGGVVTLATSQEWLAHPGTVGRPIAGHQVWAGDDRGGPVAPGSDGLLWCHNEMVEEVFRYHGDPHKTAEAFARPGVYQLGDVGRVDDDGFVYLADRRSNMIISGGVNIYPAEIEQVIADHPSVADVAVFGVPDDEWGESVRAAVELVEGAEWSRELEADIVRFARARLAGYKVPRSIDNHRRLPRQETGKLATRELRDPHWQGRDRRI